MLFKKLPLSFIIVFFINNSVFGLETSYSDRTFLFCLKPDVSPLVIETSLTKANVDHRELNKFLNEMGRFVLNSGLTMSTLWTTMVIFT